MPKGIGVCETLKQTNKTPQQPKSKKKTTSDFNFILYVGQIWLMCTSSALFVLKNGKNYFIIHSGFLHVSGSLNDHYIVLVCYVAYKVISS